MRVRTPHASTNLWRDEPEWYWNSLLRSGVATPRPGSIPGLSAITYGAVFELVMEPVLKTGGGKTLGGPNPSRSAILLEEFS